MSAIFKRTRDEAQPRPRRHSLLADLRYRLAHPFPRPIWPKLAPVDEEPEARESELIVAVFRTVILLVALIVPRIFGKTAFYTWQEIALAACAGFYNIAVGLACLYPHRYGLRRPFVIAVDMLLITLWMRLSHQWELFSLYYIVVIVAAMWFRVFGGVVVAILCSFFFLLLWGRVAGDPSALGGFVFSATYALNISLLLLVGCLVGYVAEAQERERLRRLEGQMLVANYQREIDLAAQLQPLLVSSQWLGVEGGSRAVPTEPAGSKPDAALHVGAAMKSAREFGGGDYFDVLPMSGGRTAFCIADVSGKSVRAQARLPLLKYSLRALAPLYPEPAELLTRLNQTLAPEMRDDLFIGLCYVLLDIDSKTLTWCNAGHIAPLMLRQPAGNNEGDSTQDAAAGPTIVSLDTTGPALGPFPEIPYISRDCHWNEGDRLLLFTDGLSDALSYSGTEDGEEQVRNVAAVLNGAWQDPQSVAQRLVDMAAAALDSEPESIETAGLSNRRDDITVIAVHYTQ